jgi:hypothetical protein
MPYSPRVPQSDASEASDTVGRSDLASAASGVLALAAGSAALGPWNLVAWPAATLGLIALGLSRRPGGAALRATGAICGLLGFILGVVQIAVLYGAARLLG